VAVSAARQHDLASILGLPVDAIRVIPNGVDPAQLLGLSPLGEHLADTYGLLTADLVMLMPVRITRVKNIEFAMQVVGELRRAGLSVRLVITGPPDPHAADMPDYFAGLLALQNELGLQQEVRFVHEGTGGYPAPLDIDESVVAELYRVSDLILMPSLREGFGMPVLEATLVGRRVFATSIPVTQELPVFPGLIEPGESPESLASRIEEWAASDEEHRLRVMVRRDYTWSHIFSDKILPVVEAAQGSKLDVTP
jgi:glycosyltransferase involved in cell wall biosynthesis